MIARAIKCAAECLLISAETSAIIPSNIDIALVPDLRKVKRTLHNRARALDLLLQATADDGVVPVPDCGNCRQRHRAD